MVKPVEWLIGFIVVVAGGIIAPTGCSIWGKLLTTLLIGIPVALTYGFVSASVGKNKDVG